MLKNAELIEKLDINQKFKLLTNIKNWDSSSIEGFPVFNKLDIDQLNLDDKINLPSIEDIASSWDESLIEEYYQAVSSLASSKNESVLLFNNATIVNRSSTASKISEDETLTGIVLNSFINGTTSNNCLPIIGNYSFNDSDITYLDASFNERGARDCYLKPFEKICENDNDFFIYSNATSKNEFYLEANNEIIDNILINDYHYHNFIIKEQYDPILFKTKNYIFLENNGEYDESLSEEEMDEMIDELLTKLIGGSSDATSEPIKQEQLEEIVFKQALNSCVLLKNENLLPIKYKYDIAIITENKHDDLDLNFFKYKYHNLNTIEFFDKKDLQNRKLLNKDVVVIFLSIKNNQIDKKELSLIEKLNSFTKNVIGVITTPEPIDTSFDNYCDALFKMMDDSTISIKALLDIIYGKFSPCGKTTVTYPYPVSNNDKNKKKISCIGECIGYRYYEKLKIKPKYEFGFGLSYSSFEFSEFNCSREEISFTVKNAGIYNASEIIQVYLGIEKSFVPRADKRLYTYVKATLAPGEERKYHIKLNNDAFLKYDTTTKTYNIEKGIYSIFVSSSSDEVMLRGRIFVDGVEFIPLENEKSLDEVGITLKPKKSTVIKKKLSLTSYFLLALSAISLVLLGVLLYFIIASKIESYIPLILAAVIVAIDIIAFILILRYKNKVIVTNNAVKSEKIVADIDLDELFKDNEIKENLNDETAEKSTEKEKIKDELKIVYHPISRFNEMFEELANYISCNGIVISNENLKLLLASIAATRLILVKNNNQELFNKLVKVINEYFGNDTSYNVAISNDVSETGIFKDNLEDFNNLYKSLVYASRNSDKLCFVSMEGANTENAAYYKALIQDINYDYKKTILNIDNKSLTVPKNIYYLVSFNSEKDIYQLSDDILSISTVLNIELAETEVKEVPVYEVTNIYTFYNLINDLRNKLSIKEDHYKKFDLLEEHVNIYLDWHFSNKLNLQIERINACLLKLGDDNFKTIDELFVIKLLPVIYSILNAKVENSEIGDYLEELFGEENITLTINSLRAIGKKVSN